jgi:hypothetical protein
MTRKNSSGKAAPPGRVPARKPAPPAKDEADRILDEQLAESFPASDPPSILRRD